jgi:hypothetical protein
MMIETLQDVRPRPQRSTGVLSEGGRRAVTVVGGAEAERAEDRSRIVRDIRIVIASDRANGMGA